MYKGNYVVSIIPARGGSKGIPRKNIRKFRGEPLVTHTIKQSLSSCYVDQTIVSTEDVGIAKVSREYGARVIARPKELAEDSISSELVLTHAVKELARESVQPEYVVLLQPTSPIRRLGDIDRAIELLVDKKGDSLLSVCENRFFFWSCNGKPLNYDYKSRPRRQDRSWELVENGSIYITKRRVLLEEECRLGGRILLYIMPQWASFEIDTPFDFELVEYIARHKAPFLFPNLSKIKLVVFDVDGVLTDGSVYVDEQGNEMMKFSRIDGKGIELLKNSGIEVAVITSEHSEVVRRRMKKLMINHLFVGAKNKEDAYESLKRSLSLTDDEVAYCGDDVNDVRIVERASFTACPRNAMIAIKRKCNYVSPHSGGQGFVREICDMIMESKKGGE